MLGHNSNTCNNPIRDLCVEVAQAGRGHIVSGCYSALHDDSDDDTELLLADDEAQPFYDNDYVHANALSHSREEEINSLATDTTYLGAEFVHEDAHNEAVELRNRALSERYYHDMDKPFFGYQYEHLGQHLVANHRRSELLEITRKTSACRHTAEAGKHPQFYSGVRIRGRKEH